MCPHIRGHGRIGMEQAMLPYFGGLGVVDLGEYFWREIPIAEDLQRTQAFLLQQRLTDVRDGDLLQNRNRKCGDGRIGDLRG